MKKATSRLTQSDRSFLTLIVFACKKKNQKNYVPSEWKTEKGLLKSLVESEYIVENLARVLTENDDDDF